MISYIEFNFEQPFIDEVNNIKEKLTHIGHKLNSGGKIAIQKLILEPECALKLKEDLLDKDKWFNNIKFIYSTLEVSAYEYYWYVLLTPLITDEICKLQLNLNKSYKSTLGRSLLGNNPCDYSIVISNPVNNKELSSIFKILSNERLLLFSRIKDIRIYCYEDNKLLFEWIKDIPI